MPKTFPKGGIHPPENKLSQHAPIVALTLPDASTVSIPIAQHIGAPAQVVVKKGDTVRVGTLLAQSAGFISANIHSSVSGKVQAIEASTDASGYPRQAVVISVYGDEWEPDIDRSPDLRTHIELPTDDIVRRIAAAGIVGLGGATFPAHVKLMPPKDTRPEVLIINGVECEPYLTSDHRLMLEKGPELLVGIRIIMQALRVERAIIGIENNKPDAIEHLRTLCVSFPQIKVEALKVQYPQGGEKQLIRALLGKEVPSGALPIALGAVVHNVGTCVAVYEAVQKNKPLFERVVTVTGQHLAQPANYLVRIGTPVRRLIEQAGGLPDNTAKVINGGPMMGKALNSLDAPVTKGTSGILLLPQSETARGPMQPCIRCARCVGVCPMGLEPYLLMTTTQKRLWERTEDERVMDCIECGSCSYTCPADRPLLDFIRLGKQTVSKRIRARKAL